MQTHNGLSQRASWAPGEPIATVLMAKTLSQPDLVSLAAGFVDNETLPIETTRLAAGRHSVRSPKSTDEFAIWFHHRISSRSARQCWIGCLQADGRTAGELNVSAEQVVIMPGSNQLLFLLSDVLMDPGDIVLCSAPSYFVYLGTLANLGVRAVGVETDDQGIIPQAVEEELRGGKRPANCRASRQSTSPLIPTIPAALPCPSVAGPNLVELAKRWSRRKQTLHYRGRGLSRVALLRRRPAQPAEFRSGGRHGGSSRARFPSPIRREFASVGAFCRLALLKPVLAEKGNLDFGSPNFNQLLMSAVLELKLFDSTSAWCGGITAKNWTPFFRQPTNFWPRLAASAGCARRAACTSGCSLPEEIDAGINGPLFDKAVERRRALRAWRVLLSRRRRAGAKKHDPLEFWHPVPRLAAHQSARAIQSPSPAPGVDQAGA